MSSVREGQHQRVVIASRVYDTSLDDLWDALTNPKRIARWLGPISGVLRAGGWFQLEGTAAGRITRCEPPRVLAVTWECGDSLSWVTITLANDTVGTRLELEHVTPAFDHWRQLGPGAMGVGWELPLTSLAQLAGHHKLIPPSTTKDAPVAKAPASDARYTASCAISAGVPSRPIG